MTDVNHPVCSADATKSVTKDASNEVAQGTAKGIAKAGIGFGTALAIAISWSANKSILWAMLHGALSWCYVIYYAIKYL